MLSAVTYSPADKTFSLKPYSVILSGGANATVSGNTIQERFIGPMEPVTYTAPEGYLFPAKDDAYGTRNGITVARSTDRKTVTVSGIPASDVEINIPNAMLTKR
jgi:hypothetical protein